VFEPEIISCHKYSYFQQYRYFAKLDSDFFFSHYKYALNGFLLSKTTRIWFNLYKLSHWFYFFFKIRI